MLVMTNYEILEGNKLIAEFMGATISTQTLFENDDDLETLIIEKYSRPLFFNDTLYSLFGWMSYENLDRMCYHSSWDWLMPVVEKIESLGFSVSINNGSCSVLFLDNDHYVIRVAYNEDGHFINRYLPEDYDWYHTVSEKQTITKIEALWVAVIEFIKWYNENKK